MIMSGQGEGAMMAHPEHADHGEADDEADEARDEVGERLEVDDVGRATLEMRRVDLDDQQGDRDREHRVREEDQPLQRVIGLGPRHARPLGCPAMQTIGGRRIRKLALDDDLAVQRVGDEAALVRLVVKPLELGRRRARGRRRRSRGRSVIRVIADLARRDPAHLGLGLVAHSWRRRARRPGRATGTRACGRRRRRRPAPPRDRLRPDRTSARAPRRRGGAEQRPRRRRSASSCRRL